MVVLGRVVEAGGGVLLLMFFWSHRALSFWSRVEYLSFGGRESMSTRKKESKRCEEPPKKKAHHFFGAQHIVPAINLLSQHAENGRKILPASQAEKKKGMMKEEAAVVPEEGAARGGKCLAFPAFLERLHLSAGQNCLLVLNLPMS